MTDSKGPQRRLLCFLSTLLSQKVPEKSDVVLRCIISGQPKPEVTWYKNGQAMEKTGIASSYEFFENQYIHVLHLSCCTRNDAAVYQISAKNSFGMICCSASVEVECSSENPQLSPNLEDDRETGWKHETGTYEEESANQIDEKEHPYKEEESTSPGTPRSADSSPSKSHHSHSLQSLANLDISVSGSENPLGVKGTSQTGEAYDSGNTEEIADGLLFLNSSHIYEKQDGCCPKTMHSTASKFTDGGLNKDGPQDESLHSSQQNPKVQKYISLSLPLSEAAAHIYPGDSALVNKQPSPQVSSEDSDSDYELCPEITLTYTEEFSDDDLEYLECSDVMTDYSNAVWQRNLLGTEHVFLLESDDEEMEFSEHCLGGCEHFLSGMGCGPRVSGDAGPMVATAGFCGHHSQPQEVGVRSGRASTHGPSSPQTGMTLTLGPYQDGTSSVTELGRYKLPTAHETAENDYPGIQGETRDSHQAREEFASDNLLNMDESIREAEMKPLSGELQNSGMSQCWETGAEKRVGEKDLWSKRGSQKPARGRRLGMKENPKKPNANLRESTTEGTLRLCYAEESAKHPLTQSDKRETSHATAAVTDWNSHADAGECAISTQAEQEAKTLQASTDSLSKERNTNCKGEGMHINTLFEISQVPDWRDHLQVQTQETVRGRISCSQMPACSEPAGEESPFIGTTTISFSNSGGVHKENASLAQHLEVEDCTFGSQQEEKQDRDGNTPDNFREDLKHELSVSEANDENTSPGVFSRHLTQDAHIDFREPVAVSVASLESTDTALTLENVCDGPTDRGSVCAMECFEAGDQGTCHDTTDSLVGEPVDKYLPQEICSVDLELAEGQSEVSDLCSADDKTLEGLFQMQVSETSVPMCESSKDSNSATSPLFISTFTLNISHTASEGATGESLAKMENTTCPLASTVQAGQERPSPSNSGGLEETQLLSSENNPLVQFKEEGDRSPSPSAADTTDTPVSRSSIVSFPSEKPTTLTANNECLQVTRETEDTSTVTIATKARPAKYLAVSIPEDKHAGGTKERFPCASHENVSQFPSQVHLGHILSGATTKSTKEPLCTEPSMPGVTHHVLQLPEEESFCTNSPLQLDNLSGDKSQTVNRADFRSHEENFQETGSEMKQGLQQQNLSPQSSLPAHDFQGSLPMTSAAQEEINLVPLAHSPASFREGAGQCSGGGTRVSLVAEAAVEEDSQAPSNVPSLSNILLEEPKENRPGNWKAGNKLKIITLEASTSEIWPPRQLANSENKASDGGPTVPDRVWAVSDSLKTDAVVPELPPSETAARALSPQGADSALADSRESHKGEEPAISAHWRNLSSWGFSQPRLLESSVDPVGEKEFVTDSLSAASETGGRENVNNVSQDQEEKRLKMDHAAFFKKFLTCPKILESSVDPIDETGVIEDTRAGKPEPSESKPGGAREGSQSNAGNVPHGAEIQPAMLQVPCPQGTILSEKRISRSQEGSKKWEAEQNQADEAKVEVQTTIWQVLRPRRGGERIPSGCSIGQIPEGSDGSLLEAEQSKKDKAELTSPTSHLSSCLAKMTHATLGVEAHDSTGQIHDVLEKDLVEPRSRQYVFSVSKKRGTVENECGKPLPSAPDLTRLPCTSSPEGNVTDVSISHKMEEPKIEVLQIGETKPPSSPSSSAKTLAFISREHESEKAPTLLQDPCQKGTLGCVRKAREKSLEAQAGKSPGTLTAVTRSEEVKKKPETLGSGHLAEGVKKKILSRVAALRLKLEEKENARKNVGFLKKMPKLETALSCTEEKQDLKKPSCKREGRAPVLLKKIQAEMFPEHSGNVKLSCQFAEIHEDSTICWTKDSKSIAQVQRSAGDNSTVSFAIVQASQKDQGLYYCCIKNSYGKVTAEFNLTAEVLKQLSSHQDTKGCEEIEFSQLIFREDFLHDSYFGGRLRGQIATEELHFGEGVHRKAFRSTVMHGLTPVFKPGHACVLKVHNAIAYGTRNNDELIQRNYKLAAQECYVQNTARYYAKIYAAEAQPLEGFGEVPEIIPIFLIHRPENNIPYATVEEELIGEFVKYSIRDGKEINFLRRESEAGQKCCTFQHWVYQKTSGCLLVTDMQGVGMKLTDVGIATLAKGYKGFKGNCPMTFIDQFKALHQCNKYCKMLGLKSLQNNNQKQKKLSTGKSKAQANSITGKKTGPETPGEKKT
ncbi:alpha-protein kinase 2 [Sapajus apella]|uniref:Alpha-protein kinase 2 n=1 Tax=Sapajus apella TaxID=9515 RepID=A0A6J3J3P9_SAPAP|nr:alpha-protein kinase 2 [Sapajus apella]XP_032149493.1 alpha-protein kinase 2 [Sapajus apella]